jgi:hypothetical protein
VAAVRLVEDLEACLVADWRSFAGENEDVERVNQCLVKNASHHKVVPLVKELTSANAFMKSFFTSCGQGTESWKPKLSAAITKGKEQTAACCVCTAIYITAESNNVKANTKLNSVKQATCPSFVSLFPRFVSLALGGNS